MKICIINNLYEPWARGGAEVVAKTLFEEAERQGHEVFTISTKPKRADLTKSGRHYYLPSLYFELFRISTFQRLFWHLLDAISPITVWQIRKIWQKEKPDLIFGHNLKGLSLLLPRLAKRMDIQYFHLLHDIQLIHPSGLLYADQEKTLKKWPTRLYAAWCRLLIDSPDLVISPSTWLLDEHKKKKFFFRSKKLVMPNPFTLSEKSQSENSKENVFTWLFVGQIEKHKGTELLLEAYLDFKKETAKDSQLWLAGSGQLLEILSKKYKNRTDIKFFGRLSRQETLELMRKSYCLIMPSICYENSPTVIYEAASQNLPAIVSNLGGASEVASFFGYPTFNPTNQKDLTKKMLEFYKNPLKNVPQKEKVIKAQEYWEKVLKFFKNKKDLV